MNKTRSGSILSTTLQLGKIRISIPVALTGFLGYYRGEGSFDLHLLYTIFGILLLSMGSSAFNQVQEHRTDLLMKRTQKRPIPSGEISLKGAIIIAVLLSVIGEVLLLLTGSLMAGALGLLTMAWYNLIYTPLKKVTPFAVVPGAIIGALPPMIGWVATGSYILDPEILFISFFLFIGQMPHYWLLLMKIGDEFQDAGMPVITSLFSREQLRNISFIWILSATVYTLAFPATGILETKWMAYTMIAVIVFFLVRIFQLSFKGEIMKNWRKAFMTVNLFYLFIIILLIADKFATFYIYN